MLKAPLIAVLVSASLFFFTVSSFPAEKEIPTLPIGSPAPDFSLPSVDGKTYSLADFSAVRVLVIVFTANHCPTAQAYEQRIKEIAADYHDRGVALLAISPNDPLAVRLDELGYTDLSDTFEEMKLRAADNQFNFPYLYDGENQKVSMAYGPVATPHVFIFDQQRKLRYAGRIDDSEKPQGVKSQDAKDAIEALLAGKNPLVENTKTFGCSIKWADKHGSVQAAFQRWAAEPVEVKNINEAELKELLANSSGNLRLINVWATWCGPCVVEFPELVTVNRMYRGRNFELVTISADSPENPDKVLAFLQKQEASCINFLFSSDNKYDLIEAVDPEWPGSLPYTLLVKPGGDVIFRKLGQIEPLELKKAIVGYLGRYYD